MCCAVLCFPTLMETLLLTPAPVTFYASCATTTTTTATAEPSPPLLMSSTAAPPLQPQGAGQAAGPQSSEGGAGAGAAVSFCLRGYMRGVLGDQAGEGLLQEAARLFPILDQVRERERGRGGEGPHASSNATTHWLSVCQHVYVCLPPSLSHSLSVCLLA